MQNLIDLITNNLAFFLGLFVFVIFLVGFVIAMLTPAGRDALGRAAVRFAVAALKAAEAWMGREINGEKMAQMRKAGKAPVQHPIINAQVTLEQWLRDQRVG